jgi:hypothetical protein
MDEARKELFPGPPLTAQKYIPAIARRPTSNSEREKKAPRLANNQPAIVWD